MIDEHGYRPNVGIVLCNAENRVLWARRAGRDGWQFPQGGIKAHETAEQALFRELYEEVGLYPEQVKVLGRTRDWLHYDIPEDYLRRSGPRGFRGQKQIWFLLRLLGCDADVCLDRASKPEFDRWRWIDYWCAVDEIIAFKRDVYRRALTELEPLLTRLPS
ncbi:MAG TPA: RNA pyrophosphohydrolase [Burkholderiales bacterium]